MLLGLECGDRSTGMSLPKQNMTNAKMRKDSKVLHTQGQKGNPEHMILGLELYIQDDRKCISKSPITTTTS